MLAGKYFSQMDGWMELAGRPRVLTSRIKAFDGKSGVQRTIRGKKQSWLEMNSIYCCFYHPQLQFLSVAVAQFLFCFLLLFLPFFIRFIHWSEFWNPVVIAQRAAAAASAAFTHFAMKNVCFSLRKFRFDDRTTAETTPLCNLNSIY